MPEDEHPRVWIVELETVWDGLATFSSEHHATTLTLSKEDWNERGRPTRILIPVPLGGYK